jgi:hypothetical protein
VKFQTLKISELTAVSDSGFSSFNQLKIRTHMKDLNGM